MLELIGSIISLIGAIFLLLASIGVLRMPDCYNRIQAGTKATTLGAFLFLLGIGIIHPSWLPKIIALNIFIYFTNPVSSHALARAALHRGIPLTGKMPINKLAECERGGFEC